MPHRLPVVQFGDATIRSYVPSGLPHKSPVESWQSSSPREMYPTALRPPIRWPTYLRVVLNAVCPLHCDYCHLEGDPAGPTKQHGLPTQTLIALLSSALTVGIKKIKFLGGEPLLRKDLPLVIEALRRQSPVVDLSVITSGATPAASLERCLDAGLNRANVSIHGFELEAFRQRGGTQTQYQNRFDTIEMLLSRNKNPKLNFVYSTEKDKSDLESLLMWAKEKPVVIGLLDDLNQTNLSPDYLEALLLSMIGAPTQTWVDHDPLSLPTKRLRFSTGVEVEIKTERLGATAPWLTCDQCTKRAECKEGIHALRLSHRGELRTCMPRNDISFDLLKTSIDQPSALTQSWRAFIHSLAK